jgi:hypothetical protein
MISGNHQPLLQYAERDPAEEQWRLLEVFLLVVDMLLMLDPMRREATSYSINMAIGCAQRQLLHPLYFFFQPTVLARGKKKYRCACCFCLAETRSYQGVKVEDSER